MITCIKVARNLDIPAESSRSWHEMSTLQQIQDIDSQMTREWSGHNYIKVVVLMR